MIRVRGGRVAPKEIENVLYELNGVVEARVLPVPDELLGSAIKAEIVLRRDATVSVDAGLSSIQIIVPEGMAARVIVDRGLANVDIDSGWEKSGDEYSTAGDGPMLTINVNIGAGNLELSTR